MIGIDTNVLVRFFSHNDPEQTEIAAALIRAQCTRESPGIVTLVALSELVWVLASSYRYARAEICAVLEVLMNMEVFIIEQDVIVQLAFEDYQRGQADFADYLMLRQSLVLGAEKFYTFDHKLAKHPLAELVT